MHRDLRRPATCAAVIFAGVACAQQPSFGGTAYPSKSIRLIVPFAPGGSNDIMARLIGQKFSEASVSRSSSTTARARAASSARTSRRKRRPDGYTVLMMSLTFAVNPSLFKKLPYDTEKDLAPVTLVASAPLMLVVHPSIPAKSVKEFITYAKANAGKLNFGSGGPGTTPHLAGEMLKMMAGAQMTHVPYKGGGPALTDLMGGQIQLMLENIPSTLPLAKSGKVRALAVTALKRSPLVPDLPTLDEAGLERLRDRRLERTLRSGRDTTRDRFVIAPDDGQSPRVTGHERAACNAGRRRRGQQPRSIQSVRAERNPQMGTGGQGRRP